MSLINFQPELFKKIRNASVHSQPFPHLYINDFLPSDLWRSLREAFHVLHFKKFFEGAVPVYHIDSSSDLFLQAFRDEIVDAVICKGLRAHFLSFEDGKTKSLKASYGRVRCLEKPFYRSIYLAKNPEGGTIPIHLDDHWASFQLVFYLGDHLGERTSTTDLAIPIDAHAALPDPLELMKFSTTNYGTSSNALLAFVNNERSYHGLASPLPAERWTICVSAHYHDNG